MGCLGRALLALVVLAGLAVVGDYVARSLAEREAEKRLQNSDQITGRTDVRIHGFPFLVQLSRRKLDEVDVDGGRVGSGRLQLTRFSATLHGVRPRPDGSGARVDAMNGTAFVSYADLQSAVARPGITVGPGNDGMLKVTGSLNVLGRSISASAQSRISVVDGDVLSVRASEVDVPGLPTSSQVLRRAAERLNFTVPVRGLPEGLRLVEVPVGRDGVTAKVEGQNVLLQS